MRAGLAAAIAVIFAMLCGTFMLALIADEESLESLSTSFQLSTTMSSVIGGASTASASSCASAVLFDHEEALPVGRNVEGSIGGKRQVLAAEQLFGVSYGKGRLRFYPHRRHLIRSKPSSRVPGHPEPRRDTLLPGSRSATSHHRYWGKAERRHCADRVS